MNISQQFAPPFRLIAPFIFTGVVVYFFALLFLFGFDIKLINSQSSEVLSYVHLFLLGFVMMSIFGAMAQLVPVVLEVEHFAVELYYAIFPLLLVGTLLMVFGFYSAPILLSFGGIIVFISFLIFLAETFLTISKAKRLGFSFYSVLLANIFLLLGVIVGLLMAFTYSGFYDLDVRKLLHIHIYLVFYGYVGFTIIGMSYILIPMFWLSHSFDKKYLKYALYFLGLAIVLISIGEYFFTFLRDIAYLCLLIAFFLYTYELYLIYKTRARVKKDIYYYFMMFFTLSLILSLLLGVLYFLSGWEMYIILLGFVLFYGVLTSLIIGHFYKIIPFLIWFEKFSPLVGKQKVPMLGDMVPLRSSALLFAFHALGFIIILFSLAFDIAQLYKAGIVFLLAAAFLLIKDTLFMMQFKG